MDIKEMKRRDFISQSNGVAEMFSGNNVVPWHSLGNVVAGTLKSGDAMQAAHLAWPVEKQPIYIDVPGIAPIGQKHYVKVPDAMATVRTDTNRPLGVVGNKYQVIQNSECFDFMDSLVADGKITYETAGALRGGSRVWMLAKYDGELEINDDKHEQWLLLVNSHDASYALTLCWVTVRVVCQNTLSAALRTAKNKISIRHHKNWEAKKREAQKVLGLTQDYFAELRTTLQGMNEKLLTADQMQAFTAALFPGDADPEKVNERTKNIRDEVNRLFSEGKGNLGATRWDALNAVTDYADHAMSLRGPNANRMESAIMGAGQHLKQKAFEYLTDDALMQSLLDKPIKAQVIPAQQSSPDFERLISL